MKWFCKLNLFTILRKGWEDHSFRPEKWQLEKLEERRLSTKIYICGCVRLTYFFASDGCSRPQ